MGTSRHEAEFTAFVAARSPALLRTAYLLTGDHQSGEDLLQTALAKTYVAWPQIRAMEAVEAYVRRTMVTTHISWWRRRWRGETPTPDPPDGGLPDSSEEQGERDRLWRHLSVLSERQRAVVVLRYYEDLCEAETAALLGCSTGTVKSHTARALSRLRKALAAEDADEDDPDHAHPDHAHPDHAHPDDAHRDHPHRSGARRGNADRLKGEVHR